MNNAINELKYLKFEDMLCIIFGTLRFINVYSNRLQEIIIIIKTPLTEKKELYIIKVFENMFLIIGVSFLFYFHNLIYS